MNMAKELEIISPAGAPPHRAELRDIGWFFKQFAHWLYYTRLPVPVLFWNWRLKGYFDYWRSEQKELVFRNLRELLGVDNKREMRRIARRHYGYLAGYEPVHLLPNLKQFSNPTRWPVEGLDHLREALAREKGVIILTAHFGHATLLKYILAVHGYHLRRVRAKKSKRSKKVAAEESRQFAEYSRFRRFWHAKLHIEPAGFDEDDLLADFNVRPIIKCLRSNGIVMILGDALHSLNFVQLKILGQAYPFATGYMNIALTTGAVILPTFVVDADKGVGVKVVIEKPLDPALTGGTKQEVLERNVEQFVRRFDEYLHRYPHLFKIWTKENWFERRRARSEKKIEKRY